MQTQQRTILVIEDDRAIRESTQEALEMEGYTVHTAENGRVGLDLLNHGLSPDLILLDLMMPVMNGWEFLDALKENTAFTKPPVIITSAVKESADHARAAEFLNKPIDLADLLAAVARHLA